MALVEPRHIRLIVIKDPIQSRNVLTEISSYLDNSAQRISNRHSPFGCHIAIYGYYRSTRTLPLGCMPRPGD